jgi:hypothetical protein
MPIANSGLIIVLCIIMLGLLIFDHLSPQQTERPFDWAQDGLSDE